MKDDNSVAWHVLNHARDLSKSRTGALIMLKEGIFAEFPAYKQRFIAGAQKIVGTQKYTYDEATLTLVERTSSLDLEEMLANLDKVSFPFDRLWVEGVGDMHGKHVGYLLETDTEGHRFQFQRFVVAGKDDKFSGFDAKETISIISNRVAVTVDRDGVHFDEDFLLADLEQTNKYLHEHPKTKDVYEVEQGQVETMLVAEIDALNQSADFLTRMLVLMGADGAKSLPAASPEQLRQEVAINRQRARNKFKPKIIVKPMLVDLSKDLLGKKSPDAKQLRALLGWTTVRRSKPIVSKYGKVFTRKPHDRRIPAPEDRRQQPRALTASNSDMDLSFGPVRPQLKDAAKAKNDPRLDS